MWERKRNSDAILFLPKHERHVGLARLRLRHLPAPFRSTRRCRARWERKILPARTSETDKRRMSCHLHNTWSPHSLSLAQGWREGVTEMIRPSCLFLRYKSLYLRRDARWGRNAGRSGRRHVSRIHSFQKKQPSAQALGRPVVVKAIAVATWLFLSRLCRRLSRPLFAGRRLAVSASNSLSRRRALR